MSDLKKELDILFSYITEDEVNEIVKEKIEQILDKDMERVFTNAVSSYLSIAMNEVIGEDYTKILKEKALKAIKEKDLEYELFQKPNVWDRSETYCYKILQSICVDNKNILEDRVKKVFNDVQEDWVAEEMSSIVYNLFTKNLTGINIHTNK